MSLFVFLNNQRLLKNVKGWMSLAGCGWSLARIGLSSAYSLPALGQQRRGSFSTSQRPSLSTDPELSQERLKEMPQKERRYQCPIMNLFSFQGKWFLSRL